MSTTISKTRRSVDFSSRRSSRSEDVSSRRLDKMKSARSDSARIASAGIGESTKSASTSGNTLPASDLALNRRGDSVVPEAAGGAGERTVSSRTTSNTASSLGVSAAAATTAETNKRTVAARIAAVLAAMPLSKLKIVVGEIWVKPKETRYVCFTLSYMMTPQDGEQSRKRLRVGASLCLAFPSLQVWQVTS